MKTSSRFKHTLLSILLAVGTQHLTHAQQNVDVFSGNGNFEIAPDPLLYPFPGSGPTNTLTRFKGWQLALRRNGTGDFGNAAIVHQAPTANSYASLSIGSNTSLASGTLSVKPVSATNPSLLQLGKIYALSFSVATMDDGSATLEVGLPSHTGARLPIPAFQALSQNLPLTWNRQSVSFICTSLDQGKISFSLKVKPSSATTQPDYVTTVLLDNMELKEVVLPPQRIAGTYTGLVERHPDLNDLFGGRVDLTVTDRGSVSGNLIMATIQYPFTGTVVNNQASLLIQRSSKAALRFKFFLDPLNNLLAAANLSDGVSEVFVEGWRLNWSTTGPNPNPAASEPKIYTFALKKSTALATSEPDGDGFGSFTLGRDGLLSIAGRSADGENYTCSTFAGPKGQISFYAAEISKGSFHGKLDIDLADTGNLNSNVLGGNVSARRIPDKSSRLYPLGYYVVYSAVGTRFTQPVAPAIILGMTLGAKAQLVFNKGGLASAAINPNVPEFDILANNVASLPAPQSVGNPGSAVITTLNSSNGFFAGSFVLEDTELRKVPAFVGKKIKRTANFAGILTRDGVSQIGAGHFLLPELPQDADRSVTPAIPATSPTTTKILSGSVLLSKKP